MLPSFERFLLEGWERNIPFSFHREPSLSYPTLAAIKKPRQGWGTRDLSPQAKNHSLSNLVDRAAMSRQGHADFLRFLEVTFAPHVPGQVLLPLKAKLCPGRAKRHRLIVQVEKGKELRVIPCPRRVDRCPPHPRVFEAGPQASQIHRMAIRHI